MVTRSIVGRFLILAVLVVSLGVIGQAALLMTHGSDKKATVKTASAQPAAPGTPDAGAVRVVYPGPLADASTQPRKGADGTSASSLTTSPFGQPAAPIAQPVAPVQASAPATPAANIAASAANTAASAANTAASAANTAVSASNTAAPSVAFQPVASSSTADPTAATSTSATATSATASPATASPATASPATAGPATANPSNATQPVPDVSATTASAASSVPAAAPVVVASMDPAASLPRKPAPPPAHAADGAFSGKGININSASAAVLNRLRGGGRIGQTIVEHRPYRSVEDLVRKRVLRRSVYEQIKRQIAAQ